MKAVFRFSLALAAALLAATGARAELIHGAGIVGSFDGSLTYSSSDSTHATLVVKLSNTSSLPGTELSGFAFNNPKGQISGVALSTAPADFGLLGGPGFHNGVPVVALLPLKVGLYDIGAATGGTIYGTPGKGLAPGHSGTFTFALTGTGLDGLTAGSFLDTHPGHIKELPKLNDAFVVNFEVLGFIPDVAAGKSAEKVHVSAVPEPTAAALAALGVGLLGVGAWRRRLAR